MRARGGLDTGGLLSRGVVGLDGSESLYFGAGLRATRDADGARVKSLGGTGVVGLVIEVSDPNGSPSLDPSRGVVLVLALNTFRSYDGRLFALEPGTDVLEVEVRCCPVPDEGMISGPPPAVDADALWYE